MATKKISEKKEILQPEIISFKTQNDFSDWLENNYTNEKGIWLRFYKKNSGVPSITYEQALEVALCYGWIDGQVKKYDELSYIQKLTPRRSKSIWSKRNVERVIKLEKDGKLKPSGILEIEKAKADGRWGIAYDSPANMIIPEDFIVELSKNPKALEFYNNLNKTNKYAITWRIQTAKRPETREKRMKSILEMLNKGEKFY
jgi:uncharacterized protein YdeI (YjbR/CyaY-like superfamily)